MILFCCYVLIIWCRNVGRRCDIEQEAKDATEGDGGAHARASPGRHRADELLCHRGADGARPARTSDEARLRLLGPREGGAGGGVRGTVEG